jgi:hypothetical protein
MAKKKSNKQQKWYTERDSHGASSKFGQIIGEAFADVIVEFLSGYVAEQHPTYSLLEPEVGRRLIKLEMLGGTFRQLDNVIIPKDSNDPVALFETKWLKDARHHNDKGAWILQLKEIRKKYPSVRGAVAVLAGYWTEGVGVMFQSEAGVKMVLVATDDEVYSTLQSPLDDFLRKHNLPPLPLDAEIIRESLPRAWDVANCLIELKNTGQLYSIAATWLNFVREQSEDGNQIQGRDRVKRAIDELLSPLPEAPRIKQFEIALQIETGNVIYAEFKDSEELCEFIQKYLQNPQAILDKITPKKRPKPPE